jgi:hypothetical protein
MGLVQGAQLREPIHQAQAALAQLEAFRLQQPRWLPYPLFRGLVGRKARKLLEPVLERQMPAVRQRLAGVAAGAGIPLDSLYLLNALEAALCNVLGCTMVPLCACSAVAVRRRRSASGEPFIARNFDYLPLVQPFYTLRESRPCEGYRALEFTAAPLAGPVDGINEHGLCIAYDYAFVSDAGSPAPTISMALGEALAHTRTVSEAADLIASMPRWGGGILMLADAQGDLASLELSNTRASLRCPAEGEDVLFHSNQFRTPELVEVQVPRGSTFDHRAPSPLRGRRVLESSEVRDQRFSELLAAENAYSPDDLAALMSDHGLDGEGSHKTICMHSSYWNTTACVQLFPATRSMRVAYSSACEADYREFAL